MDKYSVLRKYFGYTSFRGGQEKIIDSILSGRDSLGIMPTGAGKSICYQLPAVMFQGITIVISPLISLMKDQVTNLNQTGIPTCFINSSQEFAEQIEVVNGIKRGNYKIVYAAPERLMTPFFLNLCQQIHISSITIDEAHCVSQWGQDFRPSYLEISDFIKALPVRPVVSAFTATATSQVKSDICEMIGLENPEIVSTGFDRPNLYFSVKKSDNKFSDLLKIIKRHEENSGIVYCSTRKNVDMVSSRLQ
ncbi:MAG: RecQ family ATP-dependent DNA helicase [Ruminococcus callidus]|nr:RecQ family ATP-dependent DNA helicase [Ruminococcus callidus]